MKGRILFLIGSLSKYNGKVDGNVILKYNLCFCEYFVFIIFLCFIIFIVGVFYSWVGLVGFDEKIEIEGFIYLVIFLIF